MVVYLFREELHCEASQEISFAPSLLTALS